jgi:hypothetical protein
MSSISRSSGHIVTSAGEGGCALVEPGGLSGSKSLPVNSALDARLSIKANIKTLVCTENYIRVDNGPESPKLAK